MSFEALHSNNDDYSGWIVHDGKQFFSDHLMLTDSNAAAFWPMQSCVQLNTQEPIELNKSNLFTCSWPSNTAMCYRGNTGS